MGKWDKERYIKECNCDLIQKGWKPQDGDNVFVMDEIMRVGRPQLYWLENYGNGSKCGEWVGYYDESDTPNWYGKKVIFLPSLEQLLVMMDDRFDKLELIQKGTYACFYKSGETVFEWSPTPKLACILAVKEIIKEKNDV